MSTDLKTSAPADPDDREPAKPKLDLSLTQVIGGALAAMTAAFLGSRLSVAGTVVGAAVASIVAAVAGSVYTASLRTTQEKVKTVFQGKVAGSDMTATVTELSATTPAPATSAPAVGTGQIRSRLSVRSMLLGALAVFALAAVVLTGIELATGQALSGGDGTTINQVTEPKSTAPTQDPAPADTAEPASPSPSASASASDSPEPTPSEQPSTDATPLPAPEPTASAASPSPSASASASASDTGTPAPSPTSSATGTPGAEASGGAGG